MIKKRILFEKYWIDKIKSSKQYKELRKNYHPEEYGIEKHHLTPSAFISIFLIDKYTQLDEISNDLKFSIYKIESTVVDIKTVKLLTIQLPVELDKLIELDSKLNCRSPRFQIKYSLYPLLIELKA